MVTNSPASPATPSLALAQYPSSEDVLTECDWPKQVFVLEVILLKLPPPGGSRKMYNGSNGVL